MGNTLPAELETIFLDAGNTLIAMDLDWIAREFAARGYHLSVEEFARAEAAARPETSKFVAQLASQSSLDSYIYYLDRIVANLPDTGVLSATAREKLVRAVASVLKRPGADHELWSKILPGVEDALAALRAAGFRLVVVSNSDGSVERALLNLGLFRYLDAVLDSQIVGYEKPDPRFFAHALTIAGADAGRTLHVGDMYFQDVLGARAAGIECVLLDPYGDWVGVDCLRRRDLAQLAVELTAMPVLASRHGRQ